MKMKELAEIVGRNIREYVGMKVNPLQEVVNRLEQRVAELEARPALKYCGVFEGNRSYSPGDFVTHAGSIWYCRSATTGGRPGSTESWQLAVKRGADGRDAR